jgi:hypothetical protein
VRDDVALVRLVNADAKTPLWGAKIPIIKMKIDAYAPFKLKSQRD